MVREWGAGDGFGGHAEECEEGSGCSGGRRGRTSEARSRDISRPECRTHTSCGWMDVRSVGKSDWRGSLGREPGSGQALPSGTHKEESGRLAGGSRGVRGGTGGGHGLSEKPDVLSE